ncbi:MAG: hypothetical protein IPM32_03790 [Ignavibacteriae bacterium]|nr:hypothetical protein [Ignavibacteriota bacterium]
MRIFFLFSLVFFFLITYLFYGWFYTSLLPILIIVIKIDDKLGISKNLKLTDYQSFECFFKYKFKSINFIKKVCIVIWLFIIIEFGTYFLLNDQNSEKENNVKTFSGIIYDQNGEPIDSVIVFLPEYNKFDTTDNFGKYEFKVQGNKEITININAKKKGYYTYDSDGTLGNRSYNFILKKNK